MIYSILTTKILHTELNQIWCKCNLLYDDSNLFLLSFNDFHFHTQEIWKMILIDKNFRTLYNFLQEENTNHKWKICKKLIKIHIVNILYMPWLFYSIFFKYEWRLMIKTGNAYFYLFIPIYFNEFLIHQYSLY